MRSSGTAAFLPLRLLEDRSVLREQRVLGDRVPDDPHNDPICTLPFDGRTNFLGTTLHDKP